MTNELLLCNIAAPLKHLGSQLKRGRGEEGFAYVLLVAKVATRVGHLSVRGLASPLFREP